MTKFLQSHGFLRAFLSFVIGLHVFNLLTMSGWWRVPTLLFLLAMIAGWIMFERTWRLADRMRWITAEQSDDPIASLARSDYLRRFGMREWRDFTKYLAEHPEVWEGDVEDAPPLVRDYFLIQSNPPREG